MISQHSGLSWCARVLLRLVLCYVIHSRLSIARVGPSIKGETKRRLWIPGHVTCVVFISIFMLLACFLFLSQVPVTDVGRHAVALRTQLPSDEVFSSDTLFCLIVACSPAGASHGRRQTCPCAAHAAADRRGLLNESFAI